MKQIVNILLVILFPIAVMAQSPNWSVNPNDFQYTSTLTGVLVINDTIINTANNSLGAFVNGEVRGVASATNVNGTDQYFITLYSNVSNGEVVKFKAYIASEDSIHDVVDSIIYVSSSVYGNPTDPFALHLNVSDIPYFENLPYLNTIPSEQFDTVLLADYTISPNGEAVEYTILNTGVNLIASISGDSLFVNHLGGIGKDSIQVGLVDSLNPSILYDTEYIVYEVIPSNSPIWLDSIENQLWGNNSIPCIGLNTYLNNLENDEVVWSVSTPVLDTISDSVVNWMINPASYQYSMNIIAEALVNGNSTEGNDYKLAAFEGGDLRGVTSPTIVGGKWMYFMTVYSNTAAADLSFSLYNSQDSVVLAERTTTLEFDIDAVVGEIANPLELSFGSYNYTLVDGNLCIELFDSIPGLIDSFEVVVTELNTDDNYSDTVSFTINYFDENQPLLFGIPDQHIYVGANFTSFDLDDYMTELDGDDVIYEVIGSDSVFVTFDANNVVTLTPSSVSWVGEDTLVFKVIDQTTNGLYDYDTVVYSVSPLMILEGIPDQTVLYGESFDTLHLFDYLTYQYPDSVEWEITSQSLIAIENNGDLNMVFPNSNWYGSDTIIVKSMNINNNALFDTDTVVYTVLNPSSIEENFSIEANIYPNPSSGVFNIELSTISNNPRIELYSLAGKLVVEQRLQNTNSSLDISSFEKGVYYLRLLDDTGNMTVTKLIKQ